MTKRIKVIYWVTTGLLAFGMLSQGVAQNLRTPFEKRNVVLIRGFDCASGKGLNHWSARIKKENLRKHVA
jgi:hypothetical protein